jgi:hypothetical protein
MTDPYTTLGEQLFAAARRQETSSRSSRPWPLPRRRLRMVGAALAVLLGSATIALAASGVLNGSPVARHGSLDPRVGDGLPAPGGSRLLSLRVADPAGGLPWGMRVVHTTRGKVCVQIARVQGGQLGELGADGAFADDGRFHPLAPDVLEGNTPANANIVCVLAGQILTGRLTSIDRSASRAPDGAALPPEDRREVSFGLLGPHALSITRATEHGPRTGRLTAGTGAYLFVARARQAGAQGSYGAGYASPDRHRPPPLGAVSAITYRFGELVCSDGTGAGTGRRCPGEASWPASWNNPTRSLRRPLHVTLKGRHRQSSSVEVEFTAPFTVSSARQLYEVLQPAPPDCGNGGTGLPLERDIERGQRVRVELGAAFPFASTCGSTQEIEVRYINSEGPSRGSPHESVIVGSAHLSDGR